MVASGSDSKIFYDLLKEDLEEAVIYDSGTNLMRYDEFKPSTPVCEDDSRRTLNPFLQCGPVDTLAALRFPP